MFQPFFARVVLERPDTLKERTTAPSIIIPESINTKRYMPTKGKIIAVGHTCDDAIKECLGKVVWFAKYAGDWIKDGDKEIFICNDEDLLGMEEGA